MNIKEPLFFERNRVGRVYTGGKLFHGFFGDPAEDGFEPEEWIASGVRAINKVQKTERDGVSVIKGEGVYFDDLLKEHPEELLGKQPELRILVKGLDSAIRLPAQAHPDKAFSRKYFNSEHGKTESWIILDTRPGAKLFFGFRDGVTVDDLRRAIDESETDPMAMQNLMMEITPRKGEVYIVPAKTVHAIGAGCLILEVQEPTDFTVQPERYCGDYRLSDYEMCMGLSIDASLECFDFGETPQSLIPPVVVETGEGYVKEALIGEAQTDCFIINRFRLSGGEYVPNVKDGYAIYIVTEGEGVMNGDGYSKALKKGDYFFMPASLMGKFRVTGEIELVECY